MDTGVIIVGLSLTAQMIAVYLAVRLAVRMRAFMPGSVIVVMISLMAYRRYISLHRVLTRDEAHVDLHAEAISLIVSWLVLYCVLCISRLQSKQKRTEVTIADEAVRRRILFEQSRDGIVVLDENGKVYEANQSFVDMLGYSLEEARELHVWDWDAKWTREELLQRMTGPPVVGFETLHRRKDGTQYPVEITTNMAVWRGQMLRFSVCRDISARRRGEQALKDLTAQQQAILDNALAGITFLKDRRNIWVNPRLEEMFGYSKNEMIGLTTEPFYLSKKAYEEFGRDAYPVLTAGKTFHADSMMKRKNGTTFWCGLSGKAIDPHDLGKGVIWVLLDIDDRKKMEESLTNYRLRLEDLVTHRTAELRTEIAERKRADKELRCYTAQLQELSARLVEAGEEERRFIARELHDEIGQLLTGLKMSIDMMKPSASQERADAQVRMRTIVTELLKKVRSMSLNLHPAMLDDLGLERALGHLSRQYKEAPGVSVRLTCDLPEERLSRQMELAVYRLVQEALTNVVRHAKASEADVEVKVKNGVLSVSVRDKGTGFDSLAALGNRTSVGLVGMRERMESLDGRLMVTSWPGSGTVISAEIPLSRQQQGEKRNVSDEDYVG